MLRCMCRSRSVVLCSAMLSCSAPDLALRTCQTHQIRKPFICHGFYAMLLNVWTWPICFLQQRGQKQSSGQNIYGRGKSSRWSSPVSTMPLLGLCTGRSYSSCPHPFRCYVKYDKESSHAQQFDAGSSSVKACLPSLDRYYSTWSIDWIMKHYYIDIEQSAVCIDDLKRKLSLKVWHLAIHWNPAITAIVTWRHNLFGIVALCSICWSWVSVADTDSKFARWTPPPPFLLLLPYRTWIDLYV